MRLGSLCSGVGGLDLACERFFGAETVWQVEYDAACTAVLERHWPDTKRHGDLTTLDPGSLEPVDIICAGYPCQPFSHAGKRQGENDDRHLWPHVARAVGALRPGIVVLENVAGHLSLGFGRVLADLAALGYDASWGVVRASDAGACHQRARLFCVAHAAESERRDKELSPVGAPAGRAAELGERAGEAAQWLAPTSSAPTAIIGSRSTGPRTSPRSIATDAATKRSCDERDTEHAQHAAAVPSGAAITPDAHGLLPTPTRSDANGAGPHGDGGSDLRSALDLLPTPTAVDMGRGKTVEEWTEWTEKMKAGHANGNGHGRSLDVEARMLPTPTRRDYRQGSDAQVGRKGHGTPPLSQVTHETDWGRYADAIARHERAFGHPAPAPCDDKRRLSAGFVEFMMMLPAGWTFGTRTQRLKMLGNAVVPAQAMLALSLLAPTEKEGGPDDH